MGSLLSEGEPVTSSKIFLYQKWTPSRTLLGRPLNIAQQALNHCSVPKYARDGIWTSWCDDNNKMYN